MDFGERMTLNEQALSFRADHDRLVGVLHNPDKPGSRGVLIIVGGPQYRVGSHRQFVLLARHLASAGVPTLRFDYRGMGDGEGAGVGFEDVGPDIRAALDEFVRRVPNLREVVLWGLCDAASAALMYAFGDSRVVGLVLLNPWVRQRQSEARAYLRHYYLQRLFDKEFLKKVVTGRANVLKSVHEFWRTLSTSLKRPTQGGAVVSRGHAQFVRRMLEGLRNFRGKTLLILSGDDLTAAEFKDETARSRAWRAALQRSTVTRRDFAEANHTFSTKEWRERVAAWTLEWVCSL
jgi:exosortase A-associated hydrolase 1